MKKAFAKFGGSKAKKDQGSAEDVQHIQQPLRQQPQLQSQQAAPTPPQQQFKQQPQEQQFQQQNGYSAHDARADSRDYDDAEPDEYAPCRSPEYSY